MSMFGSIVIAFTIVFPMCSIAGFVCTMLAAAMVRRLTLRGLKFLLLLFLSGGFFVALVLGNRCTHLCDSPYRSLLAMHE